MRDHQKFGISFLKKKNRLQNDSLEIEKRAVKSLLNIFQKIKDFLGLSHQTLQRKCI